MKIQDIPAENRPRERLQRQGAAALSSAELLALILKSGTRGCNILDLCNGLLTKYPLEQLAQCTLSQLMREHGIGHAKGAQILAVFELYKRLPVREMKSEAVTSAKDIAPRYMAQFKDVQQEHFMAIYLDVKHKIIADQMISKGTLTSAMVHPRDVFHGAIKHCAQAVIVIHNHPSGDPMPSEEDLRVTQVLRKTGALMDIPLLDHIIVGSEEWYSYREEGVL